MKKYNVIASQLLDIVELVSKQFNEWVNVDNLCNCEDYSIQRLKDLKLNMMTIRDTLSTLVSKEICTGYSNHFDVLNASKINADVVIGLVDILIQTKPCCTNNEICNVLNVVKRINTELCLLVANLVFLIHVDSEKI